MNFFSKSSCNISDIKKCSGLMLALFFVVRAAYAEQADSLSSFSPTLGPEINLFVRFIFGLAIVIILLILTLWLLKHLMRFKTPGMDANAIDVISIRYLEQKKAVALVRVLERVLIVGISDNSVSLLGELTSEEASGIKIAAARNVNVFGDILKKIISKKSEKNENS
jgi:flagellar biogenesis protein FliO